MHTNRSFKLRTTPRANSVMNIINQEWHVWCLCTLNVNPLLHVLVSSPSFCHLQEAGWAQGLGPRDQPSFPPLQRHPENRLHQDRGVSWTNAGPSQVLIATQTACFLFKQNTHQGFSPLFFNSPLKVSSSQPNKQRVLWRGRWHFCKVLGFHQKQPKQCW